MSTFINRDSNIRDYISEVNSIIEKNGNIDVNSSLYKNALIQYNKNLIKGTTTRLEVPQGFCGYIDPNSGEFRVEPDIIEQDLKSSTLYPDNIVNPEDVPNTETTPYPIDQCLAIGLPGSYEYTTGNCGIEDGDNECSGILWYSGINTEQMGTGSSLGSSVLEEGTSALSLSICGKGPGINSNIGLASAGAIAGISNTPPDIVKQVADELALSLYPDTRPNSNDPGAGFRSNIVANILENLVTYHIFYDVNDPSGTTGPFNWKQGGLKVIIIYDVEIEEIIGDPVAIRTWESSYY